MSDDDAGSPRPRGSAKRPRGRTAPNPNVGCVIVAGDTLVASGATAPGGRPHAEAVALAAAGDAAHGATLFTTLEPCAHASDARPDLRRADPGGGDQARRHRHRATPIRAPPARASPCSAPPDVEVMLLDDPATRATACRATSLRLATGRPRITLKLALSIDGKIALPSGESKWITGEDARAHVHLERAHSDMILVGRGTYLADSPSLDVRLPGLEMWSPRRALLTRGERRRRLGNPFFSAGCVPAS